MRPRGWAPTLDGMAEPIDPRQQIVSTRIRRLEGADPPHRDPDLARIRRGYYHPVAAALTPSDKHLLRIYATAEARPSALTFSYSSAAALWGCPQLRADTTLIHATQPGRARRTTAGVQVHRSAVPDDHVVVLENGLSVTSRWWTALELAASGTLPGVLLPLDHLVAQLCTVEQADATEVIGRLLDLVPGGMKGRARAVRHLALADPRSGSAGESLSRGQMVLLEIPMPDLQVAFAHHDGPGQDIVDFDWPELARFGEFDGEGKYVDRTLNGDRSPQQVLWEEKRREDRIRRHRPVGVRWGWTEALSRQRLGRVLAQAGIVPRPKASR